MNNALLIILITLWKTLILLPRAFQLVITNFIGFLIYLISLKRNKYSKRILSFVFQIKVKQNEKKSIEGTYYYQDVSYLIME